MSVTKKKNSACFSTFLPDVLLLYSDFGKVSFLIKIGSALFLTKTGSADS